MVNETHKLGRDIVRTISTPKDIKKLREYIDAHYEVQQGSFNNILRKPDKQLKRKAFFNKIKTAFNHRI